jgi:hypothetical protein
MRWQPPAPTVAVEPSSSTPGAARDAPSGGAAAWLHRAEHDLSESLGRLGHALQASWAALRKQVDELRTAPADRLVQLIRESRASTSARDTLHALDEAVGHSPGTPIDPLRLLFGVGELPPRVALSDGLQSFLRKAVEENGAGTEIYVTGHSKGGALSPTLALWLADTQGREVAPDEQWDPGRNATVHAYSFAGPTAGNGAFVRHSNAVIGPRCHRIANRLDIVPHAWARADLEAIPTLYGAPVLPIPFLAELASQVAREYAPLDYQHVGNDVTVLPGVLNPDKRLFLDQMVYQHLDGYFQQMGLGDEMNTATFFRLPG